MAYNQRHFDGAADWGGEVVFIFILVINVVSIIICNQMGKKKGRTGWPWGLFLGPLGILIVYVLEEDTSRAQVTMGQVGLQKCPFCAEQIRSEAITCKHCGKDLPRSSQPSALMSD